MTLQIYLAALALAVFIQAGRYASGSDHQRNSVIAFRNFVVPVSFLGPDRNRAERNLMLVDG